VAAIKEARASGRLIVRPHPWRQLPVATMLVVVNVVMVWLWIINVRPDRNLGLAAVLVVVWGIYISEAVWVRLIITAEDVRLTSIHRDPPAPRILVGHIRALRGNTVFYDHDGKRILETRADLSRAQLLTLANELSVNVWDHRAWHGLKKLEHGVRLNPEPFPRRPPA
jgi:hypothetical protein